MQRSRKTPLCTVCNGLAAFNAPFVVSPPSPTWGTRRTCSPAVRPIARPMKSSFTGRQLTQEFIPMPEARGRQRVVPRAVFSGGGGFLGVGPSEVAVIVVVGWLLLGPDKMVKLAKDTGKLLGQVRRTADEARDSLKDAIDLDMVAAEANAIQNEFEAAAAGITEPRKSTRKAEKLGSDDDGLGGVDESEDSLMEEMGVSANGQETKSGPSQDAGIEAEAGGSAGFLDQLRRVSDPNQVSPGEVPDLSVDAEESEVERLELEYLAAKEKLESRRRAKANAEERDDAESETR